MRRSTKCKSKIQSAQAISGDALDKEGIVVSQVTRLFHLTTTTTILHIKLFWISDDASFQFNEQTIFLYIYGDVSLQFNDDNSCSRYLILFDTW